MYLTVIGTGYVGLVSGVCLAEKGNTVTCVDIDPHKIKQLKQGESPIYEPGLQNLLKKNIQSGRLHFVNHIAEEAHPADIYMIATGTPSRADGSADMQYVFSAATSIAEHLSQYAVIVDKSTVPVGTAEQVQQLIHQKLQERGVSIDFDVVSNPEFLKEGDAIQDFMQPDRVIIGSQSARAEKVLKELYAPFVDSEQQLLTMSVREAELSKYAANAFLATKISFMNEMSRLCELLGSDVLNVRRGIASDSRIGSAFLNAGCGYGGSCFPKDVSALVHMAEAHHFDPLILKAVETRNELQKKRLCEKLVDYFGSDLREINVGLWGLAFKPGTDDLRASASSVFIEQALALGAHIKAYDPVAMEVAQRQFPQEWFTEKALSLASDPYAALQSADALVLVTEWSEFQSPDFERIQKTMRGRFILDGRNQYNPEKLKAMGFDYVGFGR